MGSFTHEIKTPLTSIIGYADLLRTFDLEPEKRREYSQYIYTEGKRIEQLALHLLDLIVLGKTDFAMEPVSMEPFFGQLEADVRFLGEKYLSQISVKYEPAVVCGERTLLSMAVKNLIDNALKASKEHSEVWVFGRVCGEGYEIEVREEGRVREEEVRRYYEQEGNECTLQQTEYDLVISVFTMEELENNELLLQLSGTMDYCAFVGEGIS